MDGVRPYVCCHRCDERSGMVRMLGMVVLRVMVLQQERLPELGLLQMAIVGVLG